MGELIMSKTLKTCPFCGGEAESKSGRALLLQVTCKSCGAHTPWNAAALTLWNKRTRKDTSLKPCPHCSLNAQVIHYDNGKFCVQCTVCGLTTGEFLDELSARVHWNGRIDS